MWTINFTEKKSVLEEKEAGNSWYHPRVNIKFLKKKETWVSLNKSFFKKKKKKFHLNSSVEPST